jgi:large subunit ribosomal protein L25
MATAALTASSRSSVGKGSARKLRAAGKIPGVIYGHARQPQSVTLDTRELERLLEKIAAASTVIELTIDGTASKTLIRELQRDPVRRTIIHVDFQELVAGEKVSVRVRIGFEGSPAGVREGGGIFEEALHELEIEVDPADIPERLVVDVTELKLGHSLHVSDVKLPPGVKLITDPSVTICLCSAPREEEVAVAVTAAVEGEAVVAAEPELIRKPKEGDEEIPEPEEK